MSYETTTQFLIDSIVYGEEDDMSSPAASVAAGQLFKGGTGYFDIRQQILFWTYIYFNRNTADVCDWSRFVILVILECRDN